MDKKINHTLKKELKNSKSQLKQFLRKIEADTGKTINHGKSTGTIYLLLDCSSSMKGKKLEKAKGGSIEFAQDAKEKGYRVGLIKFSSKAKLICEPLYELVSLREKTERIKARGLTNMTAGIEMANDKLLKRNGMRVMYIVTDGMPNNKKAALSLANSAKKNGIKIMTLGTDGADRNFLRKLATKTKLSVKVSNEIYDKGIASMTKMLPEIGGVSNK